MVEDSPELVSEVVSGVVVSPGIPMSVVDTLAVVGNVEDSEEGVAMKGSVERNVCWVVGTAVVITVETMGLLH